jgi:hypothetical protein
MNRFLEKMIKPIMIRYELKHIIEIGAVEGRGIKGGDFVIGISLYMIVKNEANTLKGCLESVQGIVDEVTTQLERPDSIGFFNEACWTWLPHLQLCVCYNRIGDHCKSYEHNEIARSYRPMSLNILQNKTYLEQKLQQFDLAVGQSSANEGNML